MATINESGRPSKVQLCTCLKCTNRLSDSCYDKHTLCEKCRNQVCDYNAFCDECRSWSTDFRKIYVKHQKRVSKGKAKGKAKSPPVADDSASNVSIESHASIPVVILPLDSQSVDIDDNISNIQNIDNVEIQLPQPEVPPPPPPWYLTPGLWHQSLIDFIIYFLSLRVVAPPPVDNVGSVRRSSTAGPSDNARLNPLTQVADLVPQGPDAAPGPSKAMHVPPAPGPSHPVAEESGELPSARVGEDSREPLHAGRLGDSSPEGLRSRLDSVHTKITQHRETIDFALSREISPPSHYYRDLDVLHAEYEHLCRALVQSREASASSRRGDSPDVASPAAAPPPPCPDPSSCPEFRHSPQPGPSSRRDQRFASQDRPRPRDASSDRSLHCGISEDRSRKRFAASDHTGDRRRLASGDSPSPKRRRFASENSLSPKRRRSSRASSDDASFKRTTSRSSTARPSSPFREDRDPDDSSVSAPIRVMVDYILQTFPESKASPTHPSSRSFDLSASAGVTDVAIPPGSLLAWSHALSDSFTET